MKIKSLPIVLLLLVLALNSFGQAWVDKMQDPNGNLYEAQAAFEDYFSQRDRTEKGKGYKVFKRWENFVEPRVYPSGELSQLSLTSKNYAAFLEKYQAEQASNKLINSNNLIASATWTPIGPMGGMSGQAGNQFLKAGRLNFITIDPNNPNTLWVGAPAGGLWKSTNGGISWTTNTDQLTVTGCTDLAIDPTNTNIMYLATGDGNAGDTRSIGVLKSLDGGLTWNTTGMTYPVTSNFSIRRLIINPSNTQILLAATGSGMYRTTNGGLNWSVVASGSFYDAEFKPGDPNTVYIAGSNFRVSTNGGASFTTVTTGISTGAQRMAIAVTAADPNYVYVLAANSANSGFLGFYRSTNSAVSFSQMASSPNLLGWSSTGNDSGGQGWYDLCVAASPLNRDEVVTGGVNVWRTTDGGTSWAIYGHWVGTGAPFTHADHHDLEYTSSGVLYNCNDGAVYRRGNNVWNDISGTMNIAQIYKIGMSSQTANMWITGHQDNGTSIWNGSIYNAEIGGDGMDCFFDRTNNLNVFGSTQNGGLRRSTNGGSTWTSATSGLPSSGPWVTVWKQDPVSAQTLYAGYSQLYRSTNLGVSWTAVPGVLAGGNNSIREFAIAPSNNQVIYVLKSTGIYKTTDGGTTWNNVTGTVPVGSAIPDYICIDPLDPNNAWVVLSGYSAGNKVFMTSNGGLTWTNYSANLPNIPGNCCVYQPGSNDRIYVGMDVGVYYRDAGAPSWTLYNQNLPNTPVSELEISPASPTLLHASTYGRGVWVASVYSSSQAPVSSFSVTPNTKCAGTAITFTDMSTNAPSNWSWAVSPSAGVSISSSTVSIPSIIFPAAGNYTISVQAANNIGPGNTYTQMVTISPSPSLNITASSASICPGTVISFTASGAASYVWSNGGGSNAISMFSPSVQTVYSVTGTANGCSSLKTVTASVLPAPVISISGGNNVCAGKALTLTASGASSYTWNNGSQGAAFSEIPSNNTTYTVTGTGANGCSRSQTHAVSISPAPAVSIIASSTLVCSDDSLNLTASGADSYTWQPGNSTSASLALSLSSSLEFTVVGSNVYNCESTALITVEVAECTGITANGSPAALFKVFPNPAKDKLEIRTEGLSQNEVLAGIYDLTGRLVLEANVRLSGSEQSGSVDISKLAAGQYLLKFKSEGLLLQTMKIIKE